MKDVLRLFDNAGTVASLWMFSPVLALMLIGPDQYTVVFRALGIGFIVLIVALLSKYRAKKIAEQAWEPSDVCAYFVIPGILFFSVVALSFSRTHDFL